MNIYHPLQLGALFLVGLFLAPWASSCAEDDPAAQLPSLTLSPGPEYGDEARLFQGIPGLERSPKGRLWATWYGGGVTEDHHNYVMLVTSGDDGASWSSLRLVIDPDKDGPVRAFDPCLWLDPGGRLWLFWAQRAAGLPYLFATTTTDADDEDASWTPPRCIGEGIMMNKPTVTSDGTWLLPTAIWQRDGSCRVLASDDGGDSFRLLGTANVPAPKRNCEEPMIVQRQDGDLWMWIRTKDGIGSSLSTDSGRTWSDAVPGEVAHPVARFFLRRLSSGNLLLVKHGPLATRTGRSHLTAYVSQDDGASWKGGLLLDERSGVSYPDGFQNEDGLIYIIHDFDRLGLKQILMSAFSEADVLAGKDVSGKVRLRVLINRATGQNPNRRTTIPSAVKLDAHGDGANPLEGKPATIRLAPAKDGDTGSTKDGDASPKVDAFGNGCQLFTDRNYVAANVPKLLASRRYARASIDGTTVQVEGDGVVFVITPLPNRNRDSVAEQLGQQGFAKVATPEFHLFGSNANIVTTFQKTARSGERITIGKWGVLIF